MHSYQGALCLICTFQLHPYLDGGKMGRELHMMVDDTLGFIVDPELCSAFSAWFSFLRRN